MLEFGESSVIIATMRPFIGLNFAYGTLRNCDMVTVGSMTSQEAEEDIEIAFAHFERRLPKVCGRTVLS